MRILILRLSSLGDIILTQAVVAELADLYPDTEIDYICKPEYTALPELFGLKLKVIKYSKTLRWHLKLRKEHYDIMIDLHAKFATWLIRSLVHASRKVVNDKQRRLRMRIAAGDKQAAVESTVRLYYSVLMKLFPDKYHSLTPIRTPKLSLERHHLKESDLPARVSGKNIIAVFPGAAHGTKEYPVGQWIEFISFEQDNYQFWILGSKTERELGATISKASEAINLCGKFDIAELAEVVDGCAAVISGDSGPMHLAAALGKPQIAVFGGTHPRLGFAPQNAKAKVLSADIDCQPCSLHGLKRCPKGHFNCMKEISPSLLSKTLSEILSN